MSRILWSIATSGVFVVLMVPTSSGCGDDCAGLAKVCQSDGITCTCAPACTDSNDCNDYELCTNESSCQSCESACFCSNQECVPISWPAGEAISFRKN